ncbi:MAG: comF family protein [Candidatus Kentron sp. G]|nr:MAG: comF family protein [Candidatus Kentron sp. G]VFN03256.1 MAG: comF family protein [Candidatus Kentron sp. G]VFN04526.1 MAG: comF family protein [Candidatus Kentron sp. G]
MFRRKFKIPPLKVYLPTACLLCGDTVTGEGVNLCTACGRDLPRIETACPLCGIPLPVSQVCPTCRRRKPPFTRTYAAFQYRRPVSHLVTLMKFRGKLAAARVLGELLAEHLIQCPAQRPEMIIPIPLHGGRLRERGFNQAAELARDIARRWNVPVQGEMVIRERPTPRQTGLPGRAARHRNVRRAFALTGPVSGLKHVAVIDDVMTSGATVTEVARLLRHAGVARVDVWCCCRAGEF